MKKMKVIENYDSIKEKIETKLVKNYLKNHPLFDIDFEKEK